MARDAELERYCRKVYAAETQQMEWDEHIKKLVAEAPPLSDEQIWKLRALFGLPRRD